MKKLAPHVQLIKTDVFDENLLDFLENIDEFQQKFDINNKELPGKVKTQQKPQVVDIKQLKKQQKGLF